MEPAVRRLASGAPWEPLIGYSRVVIAGPLVFVAGTTATAEGRVVGVGDAYAQTIQAFRNVETALASAGAGLADVVQTQLFVTDITRWEEVGRAHRELFGDVRPVTAMVGISALIVPEMLVEVQAVAYRPEDPPASSGPSTLFERSATGNARGERSIGPGGGA